MAAVSPKKIILFEEDWDYFPNAIPHWETTNKSWRDLAIMYRREFGVRNAAFFLALTTPALRNVDPHDPNLTQEQMMLVAYECYVNPWYFFREVVRIPPKAGDNSVPFEANRGNISQLWGFFTGTDWFQVQIRQTGKSMTMLAIFCYLLYIRSRSVEMIQLTKDGEARAKTVRDVRDLRDRIPAYLWTLSINDSTNKEEVTYKRFKNILSVKIPRSDKKQATNIGRGLTTPLFHSDETPFTKYIDIIVPAAIGAMGAARKEALANGDLTSIMYTTTAGELNTSEGKWAYGVFQRSAPFSEAYYDCKNREHLEQIIIQNVPCERSEAVPRIAAQWNHSQLGLSDEWLAQTMARTEGDKLQKDRDFMNVWTNGSALSPLSAEMILMIQAGMMDIKYVDISPQGYVLNWYINKDEVEPRMKKTKVVAGLDTSDAIGRDSIGIVLVDVETLETLAVGRFNKLSLHVFTEWLTKLLIKYENITLVPERKSSAVGMIDAMEVYMRNAGIDIFKRVFNTITQDSAKDPAAYQDIRMSASMRDEAWYANRKKAIGFMTNARTRLELYSEVLIEGIMDTRGSLRDKVLCNEILSLVIKDGRVDHPDGMHDDLTIAWMLAIWFIKRGKNQKHYGIDPLKVMSKLPSSLTENVDAYEAYLIEQESKARARVTEIYELLREETNPLQLDRLESELMSYRGKVKEDGGVALMSVDALITKAREERASRSRARQAIKRNREVGESAWRNMGHYAPKTNAWGSQSSWR